MTRVRPAWTVSQITRQIKSVLESGFPSVAVQGELSNVRRHSSGHTYFTLKDEHAQLSGVLWRSRARTISFEPEEGMQVLVTGRITLYEGRGVYQIEVSSIRPVGVGELARLFEELKRKLADEGLFDPARKRPLPLLPEAIGLVTSPTGAALHDLCTTIYKRFPAARLILSPVHVQGAMAAGEIVRAIRAFNARRLVDVLIVARGGGSLEDLWPFNEESVARAIAASEIPVVSAVGHEIDFSIADFVADARAATPSAAGDLVVPDSRALVENLRQKWYLLHEMTLALLDRNRETIRNLTRSYAFSSPPDLLKQYAQRLDDMQRRLDGEADHRFAMIATGFRGLDKRIRALDPALALKRGYAMAMKNGRVVDSARELMPGDLLDVRFHRDGVRTVVKEPL